MLRFAFAVLATTLVLFSMADGKPIRPYYNPLGQHALHKHKGDVALAEAISKLSSRYNRKAKFKFRPRPKVFVAQADTAKRIFYSNHLRSPI
ncbi:hypothetical protein [Bdellovibrio reynosensis]|uniref:Uncharacterized protein n=1 Tax=Bdellovibrio reynosensis TaxID=2835041 RepID=A0ABY4C8K0_9BACT|nr:hypothetical protein [Bdellovibrio reynosensis]UOF00016.1 hypothetical protein MNR06_09915 [Bdellovibrio reynosensis]